MIILVKPTKSALAKIPDANMELPYGQRNAVVDDVDTRI